MAFSEKKKTLFLPYGDKFIRLHLLFYFIIIMFDYNGSAYISTHRLFIVS